MWRGGLGAAGEKGEALTGDGGNMQLNLIHFRAVNLLFPWRKSVVMQRGEFCVLRLW